MTTRRLAAILAADVVGFSSMMEKDEEGTLKRVKALQREVIEPKVRERGGRLVKTTGDGFLCEFGSSVEAVRCALEVLGATKANGGSDLLLRMGINLGDIIVEPDGDIYGDGVNVAARLEQLAEPGAICISEKVHDEIEGKLPVVFESRGEQQVKNISRPVRVYALSGAVAPESEPKPLHKPDKPSIAVLPFTNVSGDPEQDYFADALAEEIMTALARLRGFFVISRNSAFAYRGRADVRQIGRELGVRYVLEGSVRRAGERVHIGVQLTDAITIRSVWSDRYDRALVDVFALQDEIASSVVVAVEPQIFAAERDRIQQKAPGRLDAWDYLIRALARMWLLTKGDHEAALDLLSCALSLDPTYARALGLHAWLSLWHTHQGWSAGGLPATLPGSFERARNAVALDPDDAWGRIALGYAHMFRREHDTAVDELRAALDINPNFALGHACLALTLAYGGKGQAAVIEIDNAIRRSPRDPFLRVFTGTRAFAHFVAGDYEKGLEWGRRAVQHAPQFSSHWRALALSAVMLGHDEEARHAVSEARRLQPDYSVAWVQRASPLVHVADRERYCEILRRVGLPET